MIHTEFGKTIGGFTEIPWHKSGATTEDPTGSTFIFSLNMKEKFKWKHQNVIYSGEGVGPIFGEGDDLKIGETANSKGDSYSCFPHSYATRKYKRDQTTWTLFSGATQSPNFLIKEW